MIKFFGHSPPGLYEAFRIGGTCPHCKQATRFNSITLVNNKVINHDKIGAFVVGYSCDSCLGSIPVEWIIDRHTNNEQIWVSDARLILAVREPFDLDHVPVEVKKEIEEALDCLAVGAYSGFAALCRRTIQALCADLGSSSTHKVQKQVNEMIEIAGLSDEWKDLATQIMLSGHDGSHPHLPDMDIDRASILLSLMQDLIYELYTRPGKIKEAAALRQKAIK